MDYGRAPLLASVHPQARHADEKRRRTWFRRAAVISFVLVLVYGHYRTMHALASLGAEVVSEGVARRGTDPPVEPMADDSRANDPRERATLDDAATTVPRVPSAETSCEDVSPDCEDWVDSGECVTNPNYMLLNCRKSCGACEMVESGVTGGVGERAPETVLAESAPSESPFVVLNSGARMPRVGFGTAALGDGTAEAVKWALEAGYRSIDSAQAREWYREDLVGRAIAESGVPREDLFLTSKLHPRHLGRETTTRQLDKSLRDLGTEYLDLFLLHYPQCWGRLCDGVEPEGTWRDSWRAMEALVAAGKIRSIGVSNFDLAQLRELREFAVVQPAVVQRNSDVFSADADVRLFCTAEGWQYEAYSSLGSQWMMRGHRENPVLKHETVTAIAERRGAAPAKVVLRWALQKGQVVIPRSSDRRRIADNLSVLEMEPLTEEEMDALDALDGHPPFVNFHVP